MVEVHFPDGDVRGMMGSRNGGIGWISEIIPDATDDRLDAALRRLMATGRLVALADRFRRFRYVFPLPPTLRIETLEAIGAWADDRDRDGVVRIGSLTHRGILLALRFSAESDYLNFLHEFWQGTLPMIDDVVWGIARQPHHARKIAA